MLRVCVPLASLHGDQLADKTSSYSWKQQPPSSVHADGLVLHSVQRGVTADGCRPDGHSLAAVTLQQRHPRCQQMDLSRPSSAMWLQHNSAQQQQQQQQQRALLTLQHRQASLMQDMMVLQQPIFHRAFSTSASTRSRSVKPQLHQPMKHVSGTDPLKTQRGTTRSPTLDSWASSSVTEQQAAAGAAAAAAEPERSSSWARVRDKVQQRWRAGCEAAGLMQGRVKALPWRTMSTVGMKAGVCVTGAVAVYIIFQEVTLLSSRGGLAISDPGLQCLALSRLHMLLWRPAWWPSQWAGDTARQMADRGVLLQLAALVKPGTDAVVLNEVFLLLQRLLEADGTMPQAMQKAGVTEALSSGLQEGWLPRGALETATALQDKLQSPAKQQQQQQGQRRLLPIAATAPAAVAAAQR